MMGARCWFISCSDSFSDEYTGLITWSITRVFLRDLLKESCSTCCSRMFQSPASEDTAIESFFLYHHIRFKLASQITIIYFMPVDILAAQTMFSLHSCLSCKYESFKSNFDSEICWNHVPQFISMNSLISVEDWWKASQDRQMGWCSGEELSRWCS